MGGSNDRRYFSDYNGKKIDTIRQTVEDWKRSDKINDNLYYFLLASLLESADKVANTASVYSAYLKHFKPSSQKKLVLSPADFIINGNGHRVFNMDSNCLIEQIEGDILYLDPPYNDNQYGRLYHLLNTIAMYDCFEPKGKTGLREYPKSQYCYKNKALKAFEHIIENARFKYIFLSYNNEGLMSVENIQQIMRKHGEYNFVTADYQRFKADRDENRTFKTNRTTEYLHILEKRENIKIYIL